VQVQAKEDKIPSMSFRDIIGLRKSLDLATEVYAITKLLPKSEQFGLFQQMRRSAASIPSNIAEGYGRSTKPDFARFVDISLGSTRELHTQLELCVRLEYFDSGEIIDHAEEVAWIPYGLGNSLRKPQ
jgi:four helix bundle protein